MDNRNSSTNLNPTHAVITGRVSTQTIILKDISSPIKGLTPENILDQKNIGVVEVGICTVQTAMNSIGNDFENIGLVSLDGIFCPFIVHNTGEAHASLPYWEKPTNSGINSNSLNPFNPNNIFSSGEFFETDVFFESGHNIALSNTFMSVGSGSYQDLSIYKELASKGYSENVINRSVGLKAPLVLTGWGYDIDGNPVPSGSVEGEFHPDAFRNPSLWKSGPVDIRWDDSRKVWAATAGTLKIRFSIQESDCESCSAIVKILSRTNGVSTVPEEFELEQNPGEFYQEEDENGQIVRSKFVNVYDKAGCFLNESNVNLRNRIGYAEYLKGSPKCEYQPWVGWEITAIAEQQTQCEI